jgi:hypothetical protein
MYPKVPYRLSHELAHYRPRFPSSSSVAYKFSCRSPRFRIDVQGQLQTAARLGQQEQHSGMDAAPFESFHAGTRSAASGPTVLE